MRLVYILFLSLFVLTPFVTQSAYSNDFVGEPHTADSGASNTQLDDEGLNFDLADRTQLKEDKFQFQAEINRLMGILVNSIYSDRDVFLRELISNAADALDKIRFLSLTDKSALGEGQQSVLEIRVKLDKENNMIHIRDTGIGMTRDDLSNNLGRIARSGTSDFLEKLSVGGDKLESQIGQFGVGFYSAFLAAKSVMVTTKSNNSDIQYIWQSDESDPGSFTVAEDPRGNTLGRGTMVSLLLKDDAAHYLDESTIRSLLTKYSEFINFPIYLYTTKERKVPSVEKVNEERGEADIDNTTATEDGVVDEEKEESSDASPETEEVEIYHEWDMVNIQKPIWTRSPSTISEEEYNDFYKALSKSDSKSAAHIHFTAEGDRTFTALLYVPEIPPFNPFDSSLRKNNVKLYVRRVFITGSFEEGIPAYLSFLVGVVDSSDLPLNVSREVLQKDKFMGMIRGKIVSKFISTVEKMAEGDAEKYDTFYKNYSVNLKIGVIEDTSNRVRLSKLIRFPTLKHSDMPISLLQYVEEMKPGQDKIYFLGGETLHSVKTSPLLESLSKSGYDVVFLVESIDAYLIEHLRTFEYSSTKKYDFMDVGKDGLKLEDGEQDQLKQLEAEYEPLLKFVKEKLGKAVQSVKLTRRLRNSPCALVAVQYGYSANMERIFKAQYANKAGHIVDMGRVFELNPNHGIIKQLLSLIKEERFEQAIESIQLLYDSSVITSGYSIKEPTVFSRRIFRMVAENLNVIDSEEPSQPATEESDNQPSSEEGEPTSPSFLPTEDTVDEDIEPKDEL